MNPVRTLQHVLCNIITRSTYKKMIYHKTPSPKKVDVYAYY